jgi:hypothetical protein
LYPVILLNLPDTTKCFEEQLPVNGWNTPTFTGPQYSEDKEFSIVLRKYIRQGRQFFYLLFVRIDVCYWYSYMLIFNSDNSQ